MAAKNFPKVIFVTYHEGDGTDESYLLAHENIQSAVQGSDDDPAIVGQYQFVWTKKYKESVEEV